MVGLLTAVADEILIPQAVWEEVEAGRAGRQITGLLRRERRIRTRPHVPVPPVLAAWDLGAGETQVIALGTTVSGCRAVLDDLQARRCARAMELRVIGTLGLVGRAKRLGKIAQARPHLERLLQAGLYATDSLIEQVLREVGE